MDRIAVIGAGIIGVTSALAIKEKFGPRVNVTIYSEVFSPNTTGDVSAGLWMPYILQDTPMERIIKWSKETYDFALELWRNGEAQSAGISLQVMTMLNDNPQEQIPEWISLTLGHSILNAHQIAEINREYQANYCSGVTFTTFILEPQKLLPYLMQQFRQLGGHVVQKKITSFEELHEYDGIINCPGMQAKELLVDEQLQPVRGQVMRVEAPGEFQIISDPDTYIIPNMNCVVVGGTHQNSWDLNVTEDDVKDISKRSRKIRPSLETAKIIKHMVGLRPGRTCVKLESALYKFRDGKVIPIVHNYGHGGSGVTLSIGCATEATQLIENELRKCSHVSRAKL